MPADPSSPGCQAAARSFGIAALRFWAAFTEGPLCAPSVELAAMFTHPRECAKDGRVFMALRDYRIVVRLYRD